MPRTLTKKNSQSLQQQIDALVAVTTKLVAVNAEQNKRIAVLEMANFDLKLRVGITKPPPGHVTPKEYADATGLTLSGVFARIRRKKIAAEKHGGIWHIARTELQMYKLT